MYRLIHCISMMNHPMVKRRQLLAGTHLLDERNSNIDPTAGSPVCSREPTVGR